tara:strand:- start:13 stop:510 length:498 start_codon:yes stop_codon:yes gene_type:complete
MSENQVKIVYLGLGSNLGNRIKNIESAKIRLADEGVLILRSSSYYETLSWPNPKMPKYINIVLKIKTRLTSNELIKICKKIEISLGRKNRPRNFPRECDIDILDFDQKIKNNGIYLPHPRMHTRNFVLFPLFEINKNWKHPKLKHHIKTLILTLSKKDITSIKQI